MKASITLYRAQRRRLERQVHKSSDALLVRRILAILYLADGQSVSAVARRLAAARSSVGRWRALWQSYGEAGLTPCRGGRPVRTMTEPVLGVLRELVDTSPRQLGYLRSRWSTELLAQALNRRLDTAIHASTVRRWLPRLGFGYRRACPTLHKRDPHKDKKLAVINRALRRCSAKQAVFYADEADVELNPRIGYDWMRRGQQRKVPTPGQNQRRYLAGALHANTGKLLWVQGPNKNSHLFIALLETLHRTYRRAKRLALILDNYIIHKSRTVQQWLLNHPRVRLVFQPAWHPWVNRIERLWKTLHDTVTRNHTYASMDTLMQAVKQFMTVAQPWPGNRHALSLQLEQG